METAKATTGLRVVVGLGTTGLACARYLRARGYSVAVTDSRAMPPGLGAAADLLGPEALAVGGFDANLLARAEEIVVSPGVSLQEPALTTAAQRGVPLISEIELFAREARAPVIAITGSNGKSTVTTLVGLMAERAGLDVAVGGNLGTPALDLLRQPEPALYVLELSSFQLEATFSLEPAAAVVLNLSADHMDRYLGMADYGAAKRRIYTGAGVCVVNADDPAVAAMAEGVPFTLNAAPASGWGIGQHSGRAYIMRDREPVLAVDAVRLPGLHNLANALAAFALGEAVGLPHDAMCAALREFPGLPHRTEWVGEARGVRWYNDSKGTNVGATLAAVAGLPGRLVLIAGGEGKGQDFSPLHEVLREKARAVVLIGRDAPLIERALAGAVPVVHADSMDDAVRKAADAAQPDDCVLLSPACASFDMFKDYTHRGEMFRDAVRRLAL